MKATTTLMAILCAITSAFSQKANGSISGKLIETSGDPAAFVTVILLNTDSAIVKTDFSKDDGAFLFPNIAKGEYHIQVNSVQYKPHFSESILIADEQNLKLAPIKLAAAVKELDEVKVVATKPLIEVQPDKTVFNVEGSPNASGNNGMDLLRKSPGVIIDNNDNVILQGKNGVRIFIDGKPSQLTGEDLTAMLRSMQSEQIEAIEIITNPPAKYEAQGNAGIINIKLKRDKNLGTNATFNTGYDVHIRERYRAGITANHRTKKFSLFGNYNYYDQAGENFVNFDNDILGLNDPIYRDGESTINWHVIGHGFRGGADYFINKQHNIGFVANGNLNSRDIDNVSDTDMGGLPRTNTPDSILVADNISDNDVNNLNFNFNYQFKGQKGSSINIDLDYGKFMSDGFTDQPNETFDSDRSELFSSDYFTNTQVTDIDIRTAKLDYEVNLGKGRFSAGSKYSSVITDNEFLFYNHTERGINPELDIDRSSTFTYDERVFALYTNYAIKLNDKINFNVGVRMEHTESLGDLVSEKTTNNTTVDRSYTDFFPSGGLTYAINKTNQLGVNYSRRIDRPSYQNLNPFEFRLDKNTFREGNPFLQPQYTHSFQLTHTYKYKLNTRLSYSITSDFFGQVTEIKDNSDGASLIRQENLADAKNYGLNISYPFSVTKWWGGYASFNLNHASFKSDLKVSRLDINATTYNIYVQNNFTLPAGFKFELSGWYNSPSIWGGTFVTGSMYSINIGLQKSVFKGKGNFTMGLDDIFWTQKWNGDSDFNNLKIDGNGGRDSRRFKVGLTYRIGNQKVKVRKRKTGQEDEQKENTARQWRRRKLNKVAVSKVGLSFGKQ